MFVATKCESNVQKNLWISKESKENLIFTFN